MKDEQDYFERNAFRKNAFGIALKVAVVFWVLVILYYVLV